MTEIETKAALEAILFASAEPISPEKAAEALELSTAETRELLLRLQEEYGGEDKGIRIVELDGEFQMCSNPAFAPQVRRALEIRRNTPLSPAAMEVLAVVAYNQPVTRSFIEQVRGVDCGGVLNTLCQRQLVEECGRLDLPGRPLIYCTTSEFLKCFCMSTLAELPEIPDTKAAAAALENIRKDDGVTPGQMSIL